MALNTRKRAFTLVELLVVVAIIGILVALLLPALQAVRESARRTQCVNRMKQLGLAILNMEAALGRFPPSCHISKNAAGAVIVMDGWSWCVDILPYAEQKALWETLDTARGKPLEEPSGAVGTPHATALATAVADLLCPSYKGSVYANDAETEAITNYKALAATHMESMNVVSVVAPAGSGPTMPKYPGTHPDGSMYAGAKTRQRDFMDGTAKTILVVETTEQFASRWTVGLEAQVVGLPAKQDDYFQKTGMYYHPKGFVEGKFWDESLIENDYNRTYLDWDYEPVADGGDGPYLGGTPCCPDDRVATRGPGSGHSTVVNHLFADGTVHSLDRTIDAALYMFLITKNSGDPMGPLEE